MEHLEGKDKEESLEIHTGRYLEMLLRGETIPDREGSDSAPDDPNFMTAEERAQEIKRQKARQKEKDRRQRRKQEAKEAWKKRQKQQEDEAAAFAAAADTADVAAEEDTKMEVDG